MVKAKCEGSLQWSRPNVRGRCNGLGQMCGVLAMV